MAIHADENRAKTDDLADNCAAGGIVNVVDQPGGRRDQTEAAHTAGVAQHKADGERRHSDDGKNLDYKRDRLGLNTERSEAEHIYRDVANNKSAKPGRVRGVQLFGKQNEDGAHGGNQVEDAADGSSQEEEADRKKRTAEKLQKNKVALLFLLIR